MATAREALESFTITSAAVVDNTTFAFVAAASNTHPRWKDGKAFPVRLVSHDAKRGSWSWLEFQRFMGGCLAAGVPEGGHRTALFSNLVQQVVALNYANGPNGLEDPIPDRVPLGPSSLKLIGGRFYGVRRNLIVMRRNAPGDWELMHHEEDGEDVTAIDGFSESDIYAATFDDFLLHYDGTGWTRERHPLDAVEEGFTGEALVCAPDGVVYVGGKGGQLLTGRAGERWRLAISEDDSPIGPIRSMTWFGGTLYASGDHALFRLEDGAWERAAFPESAFEPVGAGHVDSNADVMLLAGPYSAAVYDGSQWMPIHGEYDDLELLRYQLAEKLVNDLGQVRDIARDVARAARDD